MGWLRLFILPVFLIIYFLPSISSVIFLISLGFYCVRGNFKIFKRTIDKNILFFFKGDCQI